MDLGPARGARPAVGALYVYEIAKRLQRANFGEGALSRALMAPRLANTETAICGFSYANSLANIEEALKRIEKFLSVGQTLRQ